MKDPFESLTTVQYHLKAVRKELAAFKSGEKYIQMKAYFLGIIRGLEAKVKKAEQELAKAHVQIVTVRNYWFEVANDLEREKQRQVQKVEKELEKMKNRALKAEKERDDAKDKITAQRQEIYRLGTALEEEKGEHMQEKRNEQNTGTKTTKKIGKTSYEVIVHFNDKSSETMQDKLKRIMLRELRRESNEKKDDFD